MHYPVLSSTVILRGWYKPLTSRMSAPAAASTVWKLTPSYSNNMFAKSHSRHNCDWLYLYENMRTREIVPLLTDPTEHASE